MEFEKLRDIIVEVLNVDETEVTLWMYSRLSWVSRKSSISRFLMRKQRKSSL